MRLSKKFTLDIHPIYLPEFESHNEFSNKGYTRKFRPWKIVYTEEFNAKADALKREKQLKSSQGRSFIWHLINNKKQ